MKSPSLLRNLPFLPSLSFSQPAFAKHRLLWLSEFSVSARAQRIHRVEAPLQVIDIHYIPRGKRLHNYGEITIFNGSINYTTGPCSKAMLKYSRE